MRGPFLNDAVFYANGEREVTVCILALVHERVGDVAEEDEHERHGNAVRGRRDRADHQVEEVQRVGVPKLGVVRKGGRVRGGPRLTEEPRWLRGAITSRLKLEGAMRKVYHANFSVCF